MSSSAMRSSTSRTTGASEMVVRRLSANFSLISSISVLITPKIFCLSAREPMTDRTPARDAGADGEYDEWLAEEPSAIGYWRNSY